MFSGLTDFVNLSNHLILIGIYCILALSLNLINGSLGVFSLGHHGFMGMGAYAAATVVWIFGATHGSLLALSASLLAAMLAAGLFGLLVGAPCLRLRGDYLAIATLGFAEIFTICARNSDGWSFVDGWRKMLSPGWVGDHRGLGGAAGFSLGDGWYAADDPLSQNDAIFTLVNGSNKGKYSVYLVLTWLLVAATFVLIRNLVRSGHGRAILAIREDETAAELMGVRLIRYKVMVFVIGAALAGLGGALLANFRSSVSPDKFPMMEGIKVLLMVVLGGLGSRSGTIIAVVVLYSAEQAILLIETKIPFVGYSAGQFAIEERSIKDIWQVVFAALLIALMLMRPNGIMGRHELTREYIKEVVERWRRDPIPVLLTFVQWGQFIVLLYFSKYNALLLYLGMALALGCQIFKKRWQKKRLAAAA